jgi:hypothetical protein
MVEGAWPQSLLLSRPLASPSFVKIAAMPRWGPVPNRPPSGYVCLPRRMKQRKSCATNNKMSDLWPPISVNRAPVLTLWATIVAERLGYPPETALTLGRAMCRSSARAKAKRIGIIDEARDGNGAVARP